LRRWIFHFESSIETAVREFAASLKSGAAVLDAGAGEGQYKRYFPQQRYVGLDLGIGDAGWNYGELDAIGDLAALPFRDASFEAAVNIVTLEHVQNPGLVLREIARVLRPGGRLLIVVPHEWEEHQQPHDYFRFTRFGMELLLKQAGFGDVKIQPVGGFFRLLSRRLLNGIQFFPGPLKLIAAVLFLPPALILPVFDTWDAQKNFTLGYICQARKS
jgi:SAM-dependent methyltransferase